MYHRSYNHDIKRTNKHITVKENSKKSFINMIGERERESELMIDFR